ncbi:Putative E3 ubiquitin-protein ligase HERC6, partial [Durusdinium trenchii]
EVRRRRSGAAAAVADVHTAEERLEVTDTKEETKGFQAFLENGQVKAGKMKDLLGCLATSPLTPKERFEVLGALQQTEEGRLGRMVELNGHHLLCQWIFKDEVPVARAALGLLKRLKFKEPEKLKLMELLERLPREELTPQVAACRKKWKLAPKPKPAPCTVVDEEEARRVKRKIQENEEKKIIEQINELGRLLDEREEPKFCVDDLFADPFA